ncbi:hypothetical protein ATE67_11695 [Sphingopyxis sp. H050]|uniref:hypothetical protein n=1 Tax=Sphingopyxis sp. H050 TaxID=1759072 RepID=UPI0007379F54|nr:hypothetical protein [Sphingopyxis sp. H050]KTE20049.1 hypothetical protein ATE67_11695 [Sphingopyxis sp. H050]
MPFDRRKAQLRPHRNMDQVGDEPFALRRLERERIRSKAMAHIEDPIWTAVIAAEDVHGEGSEHHARSEAGTACRTGDMRKAAIWHAAADDLHLLHSINQLSADAVAAPTSLRPAPAASGAAALPA